MIDRELKELFYRFYFDAIEAASFEKKIYECSSLERCIGTEEYIGLISVDYKNSDMKDKAKEIIKRIYKQKYLNEIHHDYAVYVAELSLVDGADIVKGCGILSKLSLDYEFVDPVFCGYHDEIKNNPDQLDFYRERILHDFKQLLER